MMMNEMMEMAMTTGIMYKDRLIMYPSKLSPPKVEQDCARS